MIIQANQLARKRVDMTFELSKNITFSNCLLELELELAQFSIEVLSVGKHTFLYKK